MKLLKTKSDVYELLSASTSSAALGAAIETGLLWLLADQRLDEQCIAQTLNIPVKRCYYWLQLLHSLGILEKFPQGYTTSFLGRIALLNTRCKESWQHLALDERERSEGVHNLALYITEPGSVWAAQGLTEPRDYVDKMRASLDRARDFTRMLYEVHQYLGDELAALLDMANVHRLMDAGGGSGVVSIALLQKYPDLTAMVVDIENVCIAGREIAEENSLSHRLRFHAADLTKDCLPAGFDMIILCDVGIFGVDVFRRLWASLNQGGRLVIVHHWSPAQDAAPVPRLEWTFLDSLEDASFSYPTLEQTRAELAGAGFHLLPGEHALSDTRIVLQAQKHAA
jgi:hypothetical protein